MTDTPHKNPESCTESDTPETKWFFSRANVDNWNDQLDFCERLERERDEARFDLAFRLEQNNVQQLQISELRKKLARTLKLQ
jgi:hypothetical protein